MKDQDRKKLENYFEFFLIILFLLLFFFVIRAYLLPIFLAAALVFLTYPVYNILHNRLKSKDIAATIVLFGVLFLIVAPIYFVSNTIINQSNNLINTGQEALEKVDLSTCKFEFCRQIEANIQLLDFEIGVYLERFGNFLFDSSPVIIESVSSFVISLIIFILAVYYLLRDGDRFVIYIRRIIPMKENYKSALFQKFREATLAVFMNNIFIAIVQGTLTGIGFWLFGISNPFFWGVIASFFALIPFIGPSIIWWPGAIYLLLTNDWLFGFGLIIYGLTVVGLSDNILRPLLLGDRMKVHPFLIFLGIFGGIELFGFLMGLFIGPLVISFLIALLDLYKLDFSN